MARSGSGNKKRLTARVAVVGAGVVSPLGFGLSETFDSLRKARDCVTRVGRFSVAGCRCKTAGQVPDERLLSKRHQGARARRLHRASHMMIQALGEALEQEPQFKPELTVIGTTSGGMSYGEDYYRSLDRHGSLRHAPSWIANYPAQKPVIDALEAFEISAPCQVV
ncbi:MAG TPA: beta-ketoacyl synthase N-terminal-like domain-containing protein, partial [Pyrinomonadaceae bacterium]|nr:beta-ketoacyl synthase N-terminal-like domain-containing protein [Pyrinomonadaceae bacterium]